MSLSLAFSITLEEIARLPRNLLMDVSWFLAGVLLANDYHLRYVIVSSDSESGYNSSISLCLPMRLWGISGYATLGDVATA